MRKEDKLKEEKLAKNIGSWFTKKQRETIQRELEQQEQARYDYRVERLHMPKLFTSNNESWRFPVTTTSSISGGINWYEPANMPVAEIIPVEVEDVEFDE